MADHASGRPVSPDDLARLVDPVIAVARAAGRAILEVYARDFEIGYKDDASPLTEADLLAQRVIRRGLSALDVAAGSAATGSAAIPLLSEEERQVPFDERRGWSRFWLIDPLDGTREFLRRNDEFTVNIALVVGRQSVLGVVHAPVLDLTYAGGVGLGATRRTGAAAPERIAVAPHEGGVLQVQVSRSHAGPETWRFVAGLCERFDVRISSRGSALKACLVADGQAHLYPRFGPTSEWDSAASQSIVEAAGGVVREIGTDQPLRYNKRVLRNPPFYVAYGPDAPHP